MSTHPGLPIARLILTTTLCLGALHWAQCSKHRTLDYYVPQYILIQCFTALEESDSATVKVYVARPPRKPSEDNNCPECPDGFDRIGIDFNALNIEVNSPFFKPKLPTKVFINGFNEDADFRKVWLNKTVRAAYNWKKENSDYNYVAIHWYHEKKPWPLIPPDFYKDVMYRYPSLVAKIALIIDLLYTSHKRYISNDVDEKVRLDETTNQIFGHSLGGQLAYHAAELLNTKLGYRFEQIVALDPARICFPNTYGISGEVGANFSGDVVVVHSAAGIIGKGLTQGTSEIVLNDGANQPGCNYFDFSCHHSRAHDIFIPADSGCQLVAYSCHSYDIFLAGGCYHERSSFVFTDDFRRVTMRELYTEPWELIKTAQRSSEKYEDLIATPDPIMEEQVDSYFRPILSLLEIKWPKDARRYFMDTSAGGKYCMNHYQIQLAVPHVDLGISCPIENYRFNKSNIEGVEVDLYGVEHDPECNIDCQTKRGNAKSYWNGVLEPLVSSKQFTSLLVVPERFKVVKALIKNVDFKEWTKCIRNEKLDRSYTFLLDVIFMSSVNPRVRTYFSNILCGYFKADDSVSSSLDRLKLEPCKPNHVKPAAKYLDTFSYFITHGRPRFFTNLWAGIKGIATGWDPYYHKNPQIIIKTHTRTGKLSGPPRNQTVPHKHKPSKASKPRKTTKKPPRQTKKKPTRQTNKKPQQRPQKDHAKPKKHPKYRSFVL